MSKIQYKYWCEVPDNFKSKTYCRQERLNIKGIKPVATVYQKHGRTWIDLYDIAKLEKKKELTQKQLDGIKKAAVTRTANHTCKACGKQDLRDVNGSTRLCSHCHEKALWANDVVEALEERLTWIEKENLNKYVILETATTGMGDSDKIVELAITTTEGDVLFDSLINPGISVSEEAMNLHGITNEKIKDAPTIDEVFDQIHSILERKVILAYPVEFDKRMLIQSIDRREVLSYKWKCVMENQMQISKTYKRICLAYAAGIAWDARSYRALSGCLLIKDIIQDRESIEEQIKRNKELMEFLK